MLMWYLTFTYVALYLSACIEVTAVVSPEVLRQDEFADRPIFVVGDDSAVLLPGVVKLTLIPGVPRVQGEGHRAAIRPHPPTL